MSWVDVIWAWIALAFLVDAWRINRRLARLPLLAFGGDRPNTTTSSHRFVCAPGVVLDEETRGHALATLEGQGLGALDLLPSRPPLALAWSLGCHVDVDAITKDRHRAGDTGTHAFLAPNPVLDALKTTDTAPDMATFVSWSREVHRRLERPYGFAVAPRLKALLANPFFDPEVLRIRLGGSIAPVALGLPVVWGVVGLGMWLSPIAGAVALLCFLLQQPLAMWGTSLSPRFSLIQGLFRPVSDLRQWVQLLGAQRQSHERLEGLRVQYEAELANGTERFFHPPATVCPMCVSLRLTRRFSLPDLYQGKPGRFSVSRCQDCGHHFQNPQLNAEGLSFYYRDFYDGLGENGMDLIFGATRAVYADRIALVCSVLSPQRWLDVGCGHGHLFSHVRHALPDTRLEGLDIGDGVETGLARGWMDEVHRGFFPDLAPTLSDRYDVVSMCHYLEHTVDPRAELAASVTVLKTGGVLLIEVPDPDSPFIRCLGRWWMPWFQPQHLHFVRTRQLDVLMREAGLEPLAWQTGCAHTGNDLALSFYGMVSALSPTLHVPWRKAPGVFRRLWHVLVWVPGTVFVGLGIVLDKLCSPLVRKLAHSGQYRVIARKVIRESP